MSHMNTLEALEAAKVDSLSALWARIDAGVFPRPVALSLGENFWDASEVRRAIAIHPPVVPHKREHQQPPSRTRERKDPKRTETRQ